jgi:hypothetical protein
MVEHSLARIRHEERLAEIEGIARERELARAARAGRASARRPEGTSFRRRIGNVLVRAGERVAAGTGS